MAIMLLPGDGPDGPRTGGGGGGGSVTGARPGGAIPYTGKYRPQVLPFRKKTPFPHPNPQSNYVNPYSDVPGYENYQHPLLRFGRGDTYGKRPRVGPDWPSSSTVQGMSDAMRAWAGQSLNPIRSSGAHGADIGDPAVLLKKLLDARYWFA